MSFTLPSKRFLIALGTAVGLIVVTLGVIEGVKFIKNKRIEKQEAKQKIISDLVVLRAQQGLDVLAVQDSDSDGLPDWKEALWQLDPKNPDSDGNGVKDGEQIKLLERDLQKESGLAGEKELKPIDQISRDIYTAVTVLQQSGQLTPENTDALVDQINSSIENSVQVQQYTQDDLIIVPSTEQSKTGYQNLLTRTLAPIRTSDINTITETLVVTNPEDINPEIIAGILKKYETINQNLLAMKVPSDLLGRHLNLVNTMQFLYSNLKSISEGRDDPLAGMVGVTQIQDTLKKLVDITQ